MGSDIDPSFLFEIDIRHFDAVSIYLGSPRTPNGLRKYNEDNFNTTCKYLAGNKTSSAPKVRQIVGVYWRTEGRWARGKVVKVMSGLDGDEYQVFLLDYGKYIKVPLQYLVLDCVDQTLKFPANFVRVCLLDVVPTVPLSSEVRMFLIDQFHKGEVIVTDREDTTKLGLMYGNIYIKVRGGPRLDLKALLLEQGYVKHTDNFVDDMRKVFEREGIDYFDDINAPPVETSPSPPRPNVGNVKNRNHRRSSSPKRSSGYSSSEGFRYVPAGLQEPHVKRDKSDRNSRSRSCSNLKVEKLYSYRSQSRVGQPIPDDNHFEHKEEKVFSKRVSWANETSEDEKEREEVPRRRGRSLNLNLGRGVASNAVVSSSDDGGNSPIKPNVTRTTDQVESPHQSQAENLPRQANLNHSPQQTSSSANNSVSVQKSSSNTVFDASSGKATSPQCARNISDNRNVDLLDNVRRLLENKRKSLEAKNSTNFLNDSPTSSIQKSEQSTPPLQNTRENKPIDHLEDSSSNVSISSGQSDSEGSTKRKVPRIFEEMRKRFEEQREREKSKGVVDDSTEMNCSQEEKSSSSDESALQKRKKIMELMAPDEDQIKAANAPAYHSRHSSANVSNPATGVLLHTNGERPIPPTKYLRDLQLNNQIRKAQSFV